MAIAAWFLSRRLVKLALGVLAVPLLLTLALLGGEIAESAAANDQSTELIPLSAECEMTWKQLKVAIENTSDAKLSIVRFTRSLPQYPNLIGFVEISRAEKIDPADLRVYLDTATAKCYASLKSSIPANNSQFGRMFELTLARLRKEVKAPIYLTVDEGTITFHHN